MPIESAQNQEADQARSTRLGSCGWYFNMLGTWLNEKMTERLIPLGLSLSQFAIIMILLEEEGLTQAEIGNRALMPGYATSRHLDKLESQGYLERHHHETSRRSHRIVLTEKGKSLAPDLYRVSRSMNEYFLSPLKEKQQTELLKILHTVASEHGLHNRE